MSLDQLSNLGSVVTAVCAIIAIVVAICQISTSRKISAIDAYASYLELAFNHPLFSSGFQTLTKEQKEQYEWYVSRMLMACERILELRKSDKWKEAIKTQLRFHRDYLNSEDFSLYMKHYPASLQEMIEDAQKG